VDYGYEIINPKNGPGQHPELEVQTRMYHDGELVLAGDKTMMATAAVEASDVARLAAEGHLSLGRNLPPGEYVLQVIVTDKLVKGKYGTATQSTDFEVEP
jgi:hypothetical protein